MEIFLHFCLEKIFFSFILEGHYHWVQTLAGCHFPTFEVTSRSVLLSFATVRCQLSAHMQFL